MVKAPWILVTFFAWTIPGLAISPIRRMLFFSDIMRSDFLYLDFQWILFTLTLLAIGISIGLYQSMLMRKFMSKPKLWILVNALGLSIFGLLVIWILRVAIAPWFLSFSDMAERGDPLIPFYLVLPITAIILPFLATLIIALPSGLILWKYGITQPDSVTKNIEQIS